jgi:hypothetical protein
MASARPASALARPASRQAGKTATLAPRTLPTATIARQPGVVAARAVVPRAPFALLVLALLGGSLICLLVINTTLGAASFRISQLQKTGAGLATQLQGLRQRVAAEQAPAEIAQRAYQLGMRTQTNVTILDLPSRQMYMLDGQSGVGVELGASPAPTTTTKAAAPAKSSVASSTPTPTPASTPAPTASTTPTPSGSSR